LKDEEIIVRILGKGQYVISKDILVELNKLDNSIVELLKNNENEDRLREIIRKMVRLVIDNGKKLDPKTIMPSMFVIPDDDITLEEAKEIFEGEGIIPEDIL
jgi:hypothetical protein